MIDVAQAGNVAATQTSATNKYFGKTIVLRPGARGTNWVYLVVEKPLQNLLDEAATVVPPNVTTNYPNLNPVLAGTVFYNALVASATISGYPPVQFGHISLGDSMSDRGNSTIVNFDLELKNDFGNAGKGFYSTYTSDSSPAVFGRTNLWNNNGTVVFGSSTMIFAGSNVGHLQSPANLRSYLIRAWMVCSPQSGILLIGHTNEMGVREMITNNLFSATVKPTNIVLKATGALFDDFWFTNVSGVNANLGVSFVNTNITGIVDFPYCQGSTFITQYTNLGGIAFISNLVAQLASVVTTNNLVTWDARDLLESPYGTNNWGIDTNILTQLLGCFPLPDEIVLCGALPQKGATNGANPNLVDGAGVYYPDRQNQIEKTIVLSFSNGVYADLTAWFPDFTNAVINGLMDSSPDPAGYALHTSAAGGMLSGHILFDKLLGLNFKFPPHASPPLLERAFAPPIFYVPFSEGTGVSAYDYGSAANLFSAPDPSDYAIAQSTTTVTYWTNTYRGTSAYLAAGTQWNTTTNLNNLVDFTMLFWLKTTNNSASSVIARASGTSTGWEVTQTHSTDLNSILLTDYSGANYYDFYGIYLPLDGNWHQIGFEYDSRMGLLRYIQDGAFAANWPSAVPPLPWPSGLNLQLGKGQNPAQAGIYSDFTIWNRPLSASELTNNFLAGARSPQSSISLTNSPSVSASSFYAGTSSGVSVTNNEIDVITGLTNTEIWKKGLRIQ